VPATRDPPLLTPAVIRCRPEADKEAEVAWDPSVADTLRAALAGRDGVAERRMFGALCFMARGNMLCGALADGGFFRIGKASEAAAPAAKCPCSASSNAADAFTPR